MLKAFSALRGLFPSPYLLITQIRRASSRFHSAEVGKLRPTEKVSGCLRSCTHQIGQRAVCRDTGFLTLSQRLLPTHFTATRHLVAGCYAQSPVFCAQLRRDTALWLLLSSALMARSHVNLMLCDPGRMRKTVQPAESRCLGIIYGNSQTATSNCGATLWPIKHASVCML